MNISTRTRYGIRAMVELAGSYGKGPLGIREIAQRQSISAKYLEQLMSRLRSAGYVRSVRGAKGGYILDRSPKSITLAELFNCLEGPVVTVECVENTSYCAQVAECATRYVWVKVQKAIEQTFQSLTLQDLIDRVGSTKVLNYRI
ncbi:MAG: Rrf2 family transcriptional regulator [Sedimentisphaerales bacterium]|nr:Rrf2 family transcriptional regulator [Sedimentisphaerales bacterium]